MGYNTRRSRKDLDQASKAGIGVPIAFTLCVVPVVVASTAGYEFFNIGPNLDHPDNDLAVLRLTDLTVFIGSLGAGGASGSNSFIVQRVDSSNNLLATIATVAIAYNVQRKVVDLRDVNGRGYPLYANDMIRIDSSTMAGSISTLPSGICFHFLGETYGIAA